MSANLAALAVAVLGMSQAALVIRWANAPIEAIGFWRLVIATALLAPLAWRRRASWQALGGADRRAAVLAAALFFSHLWFFTYSTQHTLISHCMIAFETHPLWTGAGAWLLFDEALDARVLLAYALAGAGVWALFSGSTAGTATLSGDAAGLLAALSFSGYVLAGKGVRRRLDNSVFAALCSGVMAALFFASGTLRHVAWTGYPWTFWTSVATLAVCVSIAGHAIFSYLLAHMNVNVLSCAKLLEPALAAVGAWLAFGEPLSGRTLAACILVTGAVLLLLLPRSERAEQSARIKT